MGSKNKEAQERQKACFERGLEERLSLLSKKGIESAGVDKDTLVKKLRANIRAINDRLKAIAANERRTEELAKMKAEKAAAAAMPKERAAKKGKSPKEAPGEGKEKKKKKEKEKGQEPKQEKEPKPEKKKVKEKAQEKAPDKEE
jgi:outer membrane biosynthesis protein TonB